MTEYINKELLIRTLKNKKDCVACTDTDCVECICDFIACMVPSDVVEVVRCKNCKVLPAIVSLSKADNQ